jgi:hemerythrin
MQIEKYRARASADAQNHISIDKPAAAQPIEEKELPKKKEGYYYSCECTGKMHVVPKSIHLDIQQKSMAYKCKQCGKAIRFTGNFYFDKMQ